MIFSAFDKMVIVSKLYGQPSYIVFKDLKKHYVAFKLKNL